MVVIVVGTAIDWVVVAQSGGETKDVIDPADACRQALGRHRVLPIRAQLALPYQRPCVVIVVPYLFLTVGSTPRECLEMVKAHIPAAAWSSLRGWFDQLDALRFAPEAGSRTAITHLTQAAEQWLVQEEERQAALRLAAEQAGDRHG